jgi:hypothetical protein
MNGFVLKATDSFAPREGSALAPAPRCAGFDVLQHGV